MAKEVRNYSIIFKELGKLSKEPENEYITDEINELEEIRVIREIVIEMNTPVQIYYVST